MGLPSGRTSAASFHKAGGPANAGPLIFCQLGITQITAKEICRANYCLEGVSQADKVKLHEVVRSPIRNDTCSLGEYSDMRRKPIFESPANAAEHPVRPNILANAVYASTRDKT